MKTTNAYSRFWVLLARMPTSDREDLKKHIVLTFTNGRTDSLKEMTMEEYNKAIREMEKKLNIRTSIEYNAIRRKRSEVLHQMQIIGIDTANWASVDTFCENSRIAGKPFRKLSGEELDNVYRRIRAIRHKDEKNCN